LARLSSEVEQWAGYLDEASDGLRNLAVSGGGGRPLTAAEGFAGWVALTQEIREGGRCVYFVGNGASAMMASHFAADACKNGGLRAMAFNDAALLTAVANDVAFSDVFSLPIRRLASCGDLLIAISSSGNSPNIMCAIEAARAMSMEVVTLTGMRADNRARACGDLNFYVPSFRYGWVECAHQLILHYWLDQYLNLHADGAL
jgi:D-sedoheptulose 7-phosphate isomerase